MNENQRLVTVQNRTHLSIRQLAVLVLSLLLVGLMVFINKRDSGAPQTGLAAVPVMPIVSMNSRISTSWFCPGVPGNDGTVSGSIVISNPSDSDFNATVTRLGVGVAPVVTAVTVAARSQATVNVKDGIEASFISTIVEIFGGVGTAEQFINHPAGNSVAQCANEPATDWYFADGFTGADSLDHIVLTNPYSDSTVVDVAFVTKDSTREPAHLHGFVIPPRSVVALNMADEGARNEPVVAVEVHATAGKLVVGRSQHYLGDGRLGYTMALGASGVSSEWWFADGEKSDGNTEQLVILNPTDTDINLSVMFVNGVNPDSQIEPASLTAPAGRVTLFDTGSLPNLPNGRYGIIVSTIGDPGAESPGVVVEQVINRRVGNTVGTSVVLGAPMGATSTVWCAPSGVSSGIEDSIVILNATPVEGTVTISQVGPAGEVVIAGLESVVLPASGLVSIPVPAGVSNGEVIIRATIPVVAQRMLLRGHDLIGRSAVLALPTVPSPEAAP
jgi:hypothetical protein